MLQLLSEPSVDTVGTRFPCGVETPKMEHTLESWKKLYQTSQSWSIIRPWASVWRQRCSSSLSLHLIAFSSWAKSESIDVIHICRGDMILSGKVSTKPLCQFVGWSPTLPKPMSLSTYRDGSFGVCLVSERLERLEASIRRNGRCDKFIKSFGDPIYPTSVSACSWYLQRSIKHWE